MTSPCRRPRLIAALTPSHQTRHRHPPRLPLPSGLFAPSPSVLSAGDKSEISIKKNVLLNIPFSKNLYLLFILELRRFSRLETWEQLWLSPKVTKSIYKHLQNYFELFGSARFLPHIVLMLGGCLATSKRNNPVGTTCCFCMDVTIIHVQRNM